MSQADEIPSGEPAQDWIERELSYVASVEEIRESIGNFNREAPGHREYLAPLMRRYFRYWVFDRRSGQFGPNKFVGFREMTVEKYRLAAQLNKEGLDGKDLFDGRWTRREIKRVTGRDYAADAELEALVEDWAIRLLGTDDPFRGRDRSKWGFIRI